MDMRFVQLGREVTPRNAADRMHKAAIVGIKNDTFVVIQKQDRSREIVRIRDVVLTDRVYSMEDLKDSSCDLYKAVEEPKRTNDFDRYMINLREKIINEMIREKGIKN